MPMRCLQLFVEQRHIRRQKCCKSLSTTHSRPTFGQSLSSSLIKFILFPPHIFRSFGVVGFVMLVDRLPFKESNKAQMLDDQRNRRYRFPSRLGLSGHCRAAIDTILTFDPNKRPVSSYWKRPCLELPRVPSRFGLD